MRIYYQAGADGKIVNLDKPPYWMQTGDFLNYSWEYTLSGKCIGELRKTIQEKGFTITIFGKEQAEYERNVDALHEVFEKDVLKKKPGRFYFGEYYISCFIYASEKEEWESGYSMENTLKLIEANPFWRKETLYQFLPEVMDSGAGEQIPVETGEIYTGEAMDNQAALREFSFDFLRRSDRKVRYPQLDLPFDFVKPRGRRTIDNTTAFSESNFILTIYGFVDTPSILIAGHPYVVNTTIYEGERVIIDSAAGTVKKIGRLGEETNLYNSRGKEYSVFQKILPGVQTVNWSGGFGFDILLYDERSEPRWSL
nr:MAG TPA: tail protein [Siphoviridae sp. ctqOv4]